MKHEARHDDEHIHRRFFIGPMPEKALAEPLGDRKGKKKANLTASTEEYEEAKLHRIINENAFAFFLRHGGREEDWNEDQERSVRQEMARRWREQLHVGSEVQSRKTVYLYLLNGDRALV